MNLFYITCKDKAEAKNISKKLLSKKLIACANIFPIESLYNWKGKLNKENEFAMILKTKKSKLNKVKKLIKKNHSYDVPCICSWNENANKEYEDYINEET